MGYHASVCIFQGLRFSVDEETLKRDLDFLKILDNEWYSELIKNCKDDSEINDELYGNSDSDPLPNGYYMIYNNKYLYIGLFAHYYSVVKCNDGNIMISLPSETEVENFKNFCVENNIDKSSYGTHIFTVDS